jgi:hypothetical protein
MCHSCVAAPPEDEAGEWSLHGAGGVGLKALRGALLSSKEWNNTATRERTVRARGWRGCHWRARKKGSVVPHAVTAALAYQLVTRTTHIAAALLESRAGPDAAAASAMAVLLRRKRGCDLTKAHLLELCRLWRYRSDAWCARLCLCSRISRRSRTPSHAALACSLSQGRSRVALTIASLPAAACAGSARAR